MVLNLSNPTFLTSNIYTSSSRLIQMSNKESKSKFELLTEAEFEKIAEINHVSVSDGTQLRILRSYAPKETSEGITLVLIAGWVSIVLGWDDFLLEAKDYFDIVYIESREKGSSFVPKKAKFDLDRYSLDIEEVIEHLDLDEKRLIVFTTSFGALLVANMLKKSNIDPFLSILIGPIERIPMPLALRLSFVILPAWLFNFVKPFGLWWVRKFKTEDEYQAARYIRSINDADPIKWKKSTKSVAFTKFWYLYNGLENNILVIDESEDPLHDTEVTQRIASMMPNSKIIDIKTNKAAHSSPMIKIILEQIKKEKK